MGQIYETACQLWKMEADTLRYMAEVINEKAFEQTVEEISRVVDRGGHILVTGKGATGIAAHWFAYSLNSLELPAVYLEPTPALLNVAHDRDMVVLISKGGSTQEIVNLIQPLKNRGCRILGITQNPASMLGMYSDLMLRIIVVKAMKQQDSLGHGACIALNSLLDGLTASLFAFRSKE